MKSKTTISILNYIWPISSYGLRVMLTSLDSMRNEYVSTILHTALRIAEDTTKKKFSMRPEYEIIGDESSGRVDYAIKVKPCIFLPLLLDLMLS